MDPEEVTNDTLIRLSDFEDMLRCMAYDGGPFTYYGILEAVRALPKIRRHRTGAERRTARKDAAR
jgi:hypothetical protein